VGKDIAKTKLVCWRGAAALACLDLLVSLGEAETSGCPISRSRVPGPKRGNGPEQVRHDFGERSRRCLAGVAGLVRVPFPLFAPWYTTPSISDTQMFSAFNPRLTRQIETGKRSGTRARAHELRLGDVLAHDAQSVQYAGADDDGRSVAGRRGTPGSSCARAASFDLEAFRSLDVLQVGSAESGFQRRDDLDQLVRSSSFTSISKQFDPANVLKSTHLLPSPAWTRAARLPPTQHGGPICHDADKVSRAVSFARLRGVAHDLSQAAATPACMQREIALVQQNPWSEYRDLSRRLPEVILQGAPAQDFIHGKFAT